MMNWRFKKIFDLDAFFACLFRRRVAQGDPGILTNMFEHVTA